MSIITEKKLRAIVRQYISENVITEDEEMTDELTKIIAKLGIGKDVNKSVLAGAMTKRDVRSCLPLLLICFLIAKEKTMSTNQNICVKLLTITRAWA